jgi:hypothetical protein
MRAPGVVEIGKPDRQAGAAMEKGRRRPLRHAGIAVGCSRHHTLEQPQHAAHALDPIEGGDEMHLAGSRVCEADIDAAREQRGHQAFRAVHCPVRHRFPLVPPDSHKRPVR